MRSQHHARRQEHSSISQSVSTGEHKSRGEEEEEILADVKIHYCANNFLNSRYSYKTLLYIRPPLVEESMLLQYAYTSQPREK